MELKINTNETEFELYKVLNISEERRLILRQVITDIKYEMQTNDATKHILTPYYQRIANACENIEEYTYCLHLYIFYLGKTGNITKI